MAETNTGLIVSIASGLPASFDQVGYEALSYTEILNVTDAGNGGSTQSKVQWTPLKDAVQKSEKGSTQFTPRTLVFVRDSADAGQQLLLEGSEGANKFNEYSLKIEWADSSDVEYASGKLFNFTREAGTIDNMRTSSTEFQQNYAGVDV